MASQGQASVLLLQVETFFSLFYGINFIHML
jgi:hypothetical protein